MTEWLRRAGTGRDADGWRIIWSVAEGKRGRRWREVRCRETTVASSLLLETGPDGRFSHLELSTPSGLMTLHPENDGTLHGNAIVSDGVEHVIGRPWDPDAIVLLEGSTICVVAAAELLRRSIRPWSAASIPSVTIGPGTLLLDDHVPTRVERVTASEWRFGRDEPFHLDDHGLPLLKDGEIWPLEE